MNLTHSIKFQAPSRDERGGEAAIPPPPVCDPVGIRAWGYRVRVRQVLAVGFKVSV